MNEEVEKLKRDFLAQFRQIRVEIAQARDHAEKAVNMIEWIDKQIEEELKREKKS